MVEKVTEYLESKNWVYTQKNNIITLPLGGSNGIFHTVLRVREDISFLSFVSFFGSNCPFDKRKEVAVLLTHLNSNLLYGNFEMNLDDGDIKFRTGLYYEGMELNNEIMENLIIRNISSMDVSSIQISKFIFGNESIIEVYNALYPPSQLLEDTKETKLIE